jgi:hypothetical protein
MSGKYLHNALMKDKRKILLDARATTYSVEMALVLGGQHYTASDLSSHLISLSCSHPLLALSSHLSSTTAACLTTSIAEWSWQPVASSAQVGKAAQALHELSFWITIII